MTRTVDLIRAADLAAATTGVVTMPNQAGHNLTKIPTHGQHNWTLTTVSLGAATVELRGTNNPDPADQTGEVLLTNTHGAANSQHGSAANKGYKYVVLVATANAGGIDKFFLHGTGFAGTH